MIRAVMLCCALGGCVTTAGIARSDRVTLPLLVGAIAADLVIIPLIVGQSSSFSTTGAIAAGLAVTGADFGIGCILGACSALRP